jgi:hypothetical protein
MKMDPANPTAPFNLGNVLRSNGRNLEAETAYRAAVGANPKLHRNGTTSPKSSTVSAATTRRVNGVKLLGAET